MADMENWKKICAVVFGDSSSEFIMTKKLTFKIRSRRRRRRTREIRSRRIKWK